jgi:hypothetical protein
MIYCQFDAVSARKLLDINLTERERGHVIAHCVPAVLLMQLINCGFRISAQQLINFQSTLQSPCQRSEHQLNLFLFIFEPTLEDGGVKESDYE